MSTSYDDLKYSHDNAMYFAFPCRVSAVGRYVLSLESRVIASFRVPLFLRFLSIHLNLIDKRGGAGPLGHTCDFAVHM